MILCPTCKSLKNRDDFENHAGHPNGKQTNCRACRKVIAHNYYIGNKDKSIARAKKNNEIHQKQYRELVWNYLAEHPCACGESDPIVLEFDHDDQSTKFKEISKMSGFSLDKVKEELTKCTVRCCNCHRRKTANQLGFWKVLL